MGLVVLIAVFCVTLVCLPKSDSSNSPARSYCTSRSVANQFNMVELCRERVWERPAGANLVRLNGYGEVLCPDTKRWIVTQLYPTWQKLYAIMDVKLFMFGKASQHKSGDHWEFTCQHGPEECRGNVLFTCVIHLYPDVNKWLPYIDCFAKKVRYNVDDVAHICANATGMNYNRIEACADSSAGNVLESQVGAATEALNPALTWVPWITLDGVHTPTIQDEGEHYLFKFVCDSYKGKTPDVCLEMYANA